MFNVEQNTESIKKFVEDFFEKLSKDEKADVSARLLFDGYSLAFSSECISEKEKFYIIRLNCEHDDGSSRTIDSSHVFSCNSHVVVDECAKVAEDGTVRSMHRLCGTFGVNSKDLTYDDISRAMAVEMESMVERSGMKSHKQAISFIKNFSRDYCKMKVTNIDDQCNQNYESESLGHLFGKKDTSKNAREKKKKSKRLLSLDRHELEDECQKDFFKALLDGGDAEEVDDGEDLFADMPYYDERRNSHGGKNAFVERMKHFFKWLFDSEYRRRMKEIKKNSEEISMLGELWSDEQKDHDDKERRREIEKWHDDEQSIDDMSYFEKRDDLEVECDVKE